jgi:hypothetical protein
MQETSFPNPEDYKKLTELCHQANAKWWLDIKTGKPIERNKGELLALIHSEISECLEGERKDLQDDKLPQFKMAVVELADCLIRVFDYAGGFEVPLQAVRLPIVSKIYNKGEFLNLLHTFVGNVDPYSRFKEDPYSRFKEDETHWLSYLVFSVSFYAAFFNYPLERAFWAKMEYNATRRDHTHEARAEANGKKF